MALPTRKPVLKPAVTRLQLNRTFETQDEMHKFVKTNHPTATIKVFWPVQVYACIIETPDKIK